MESMVSYKTEQKIWLVTVKILILNSQQFSQLTLQFLYRDIKDTFQTTSLSTHFDLSV